MRKKVLISSILTIALCISLIAGSTFALFTSTSQVNVAVTSGKVSVTATASGLVLGSNLGETLPETSATLAGNVITIDKMVPGDFVTFTITIHNASDVTVKYKTIFTKTSGDESFFNALKITVDQQPAEDVPSVLALNDAAAPAVATPAGTMLPGCADIVLNVKVELPESAGNEHQEKTCAFAYTVEAVQGNGEFVEDNVHYVTDIPTLRDAAAKGGTIKLMNDITFTNDSDLDASRGEKETCMLFITKDVTLDLNGKKLEYNGGGACPVGIRVMRGSTLNIIDSSSEQTGAVISNSSYDNNQTWLLCVTGESTANVEAGNFKAICGSIIYKNNGWINISGGRFETEIQDNAMINLGVGFSNYGPIIISGGSFKNFQPGVTNGSENKVADGYKVEQDGEWYNVVPE